MTVSMRTSRALTLLVAMNLLASAAVVTLSSYGVLSTFALGHYLYAAPSQLTFRINVFIWFEVAAAIALMIFTPFLDISAKAVERTRRLPPAPDSPERTTAHEAFRTDIVGRSWT